MNKALLEIFLEYCKESGHGISVSLRGKGVDLDIHVGEFDYYAEMDKVYILDGQEDVIVLDGLDNAEVMEFDDRFWIRNGDMEIVIYEV